MVKSKKDTIIRVVVLAGIVLVIAAIALSKNLFNSEKTDDQTQSLFSQYNITSINLEQLKEKKQPILINFGAKTGCPPCTAMAPYLEEIYKKNQDKAVIRFIDAWLYPNEISDYPISVVPTQVFFDAQGKPYVPSEAVEEEINYFKKYYHKDTNEHLFTVHEGLLTEAQMQRILAEMGVA